VRPFSQIRYRKHAKLYRYVGMMGRPTNVFRVFVSKWRARRRDYFGNYCRASVRENTSLNIERRDSARPDSRPCTYETYERFSLVTRRNFTSSNAKRFKRVISNAYKMTIATIARCQRHVSDNSKCSGEKTTLYTIISPVARVTCRHVTVAPGRNGRVRRIYSAVNNNFVARPKR